jgi:hypothetical protein
VKLLLTFCTVTLPIGAFLYPLFVWGAGRSLSWLVEAGLAGGGGAGLYLLFRFRRDL